MSKTTEYLKKNTQEKHTKMAKTLDIISYLLPFGHPTKKIYAKNNNWKP